MTTGTVAAIVAAFLLLAIAVAAQRYYESLDRASRRRAWIPAAAIAAALGAFAFLALEGAERAWYLSAAALAAVAAVVQFLRGRGSGREGGPERTA